MTAETTPTWVLSQLAAKDAEIARLTAKEEKWRVYESQFGEPASITNERNLRTAAETQAARMRELIKELLANLNDSKKESLFEGDLEERMIAALAPTAGETPEQGERHTHGDGTECTSAHAAFQPDALTETPEVGNE
jgi:hypothetical protein